MLREGLGMGKLSRDQVIGQMFGTIQITDRDIKVMTTFSS
jgi:hypothetical protein